VGGEEVRLDRESRATRFGGSPAIPDLEEVLRFFDQLRG
jgi:hypothetical protein